MDGVDRIPVCSTCFNTIKLCEFPTEEVLKGKLLLAVHEADGFDENATMNI